MSLDRYVKTNSKALVYPIRVERVVYVKRVNNKLVYYIKWENEYHEVEWLKLSGFGNSVKIKRW